MVIISLAGGTVWLSFHWQEVLYGYHFTGRRYCMVIISLAGGTVWLSFHWQEVLYGYHFTGRR